MSTKSGLGAALLIAFAITNAGCLSGQAPTASPQDTAASGATPLPATLQPETGSQAPSAYAPPMGGQLPVGAENGASCNSAGYQLTAALFAGGNTEASATAGAATQPAGFTASGGPNGPFPALANPMPCLYAGNVMLTGGVNDTSGKPLGGANLRVEGISLDPSAPDDVVVAVENGRYTLGWVPKGVPFLVLVCVKNWGDVQQRVTLPPSGSAAVNFGGQATALSPQSPQYAIPASALGQ